ncbi:hypothetical protein VA596_41465 [Amycolatopsis sp., V23-08]|uniref:Anti-sigma factor NepR domain-containing protein n=1 Tax=Amycolatopsis heterodermiae TaxID=3110235 RepID=A0ABU5RKK0_9PSEU|nr:hypothetical protein [Amycolatopsis sp., V23-08]MEA5366055.1 hypothetical protein [Amycolatopsis sp., V23-08]
MTVDEQLAELLAAWRDDVEAVPLPPMPRVQALLEQLEASA